MTAVYKYDTTNTSRKNLTSNFWTENTHSATRYNYCANNPIVLQDPNGEEVEYNSFADRMIVGLTKLFNADFRAKFKELKKSEETYVFKQNKAGKNSFSTDGDKLFINYSLTSDGKEYGETKFSLLRHETTHAIQFEHGELGFENNGGGWSAINYDIMDEVEAHNVGSYGFFLRDVPRAHWGRSSTEKDDEGQSKPASVEEKVNRLQNTPGYSGLKVGPLNNTNPTKIKDSFHFMLPYRKR